MSHDGVNRSDGRKISQFPANTEIPSDAYLTLISGSTNYKISKGAFLSALNVTGTIVPVGTGTPVLSTSSDVHQIKAILAGSGASVTADLNGNVVVAFENPTEVVANYTVTGNNETVICGGASNFTVTLKASPSLGDRATVIYQGSGATITIAGNGHNINGATSTTIGTAAYTSKVLISTSTQWVVL